MKRFLTYLTAFLLLLTCLLPASATETTESTGATEVVREPGYCGEDIQWAYEDGVLTISGSGPMDDFPDGAPWEEYRDEIHTVVLAGSISYIGQNAFRDYDALTWVDFGNSLREIGPDAFQSCDGLTEVYLPRTFKIFGLQCFMGCKNLHEIHTEGSELTFRDNSMWQVYATIYFPAERPWGVGYIEDMEKVFKGRIEFLASDGTDPYSPTEPTEEPTEPPTTVPPTTETPTEATTEPTAPAETVTEPAQTVESTTEAPTEQLTQPETEPETAEPTDPPEEEKKSGSWIGVVIVGTVMVLLLLGAAVFGKGNRRGKYSR